MSVKTLRRQDVDMTQGNITRHLLSFALPLILGNLFQQMYNLVDTYVVGNYASNEAYAAVGSVGVIVNIFIGLFSGFAAGAGTGLAVGATGAATGAGVGRGIGMGCGASGTPPPTCRRHIFSRHISPSVRLMAVRVRRVSRSLTQLTKYSRVGPSA